MGASNLIDGLTADWVRAAATLSFAAVCWLLAHLFKLRGDGKKPPREVVPLLVSAMVIFAVLTAWAVIRARSAPDPHTVTPGFSTPPSKTDPSHPKTDGEPPHTDGGGSPNEQDGKTPALSSPPPDTPEDPLPATRDAGAPEWAVQLGVFSSETAARTAFADAIRIGGAGQRLAPDFTQQDDGTSYRATVSGFPARGDAERFCQKLQNRGKACSLK